MIRCDWCFQPAKWQYDVRPTRTRQTIAAPDGQLLTWTLAFDEPWWACDECQALIRNGSRDELAERAVRACIEATMGRKLLAALPEAAREYLASQTDAMRRLHDSFWANRCSAEPTEIVA